MATDEPTELLPCAICTRTFKPESLEKHTRICERSAIKKRKPFDSAKQRIQGTELAEFMPKETPKRKPHQSEERKIETSSDSKGTWKQTHDEFLRAIRAARGETVESPPQRQVASISGVTIGVPTRPNEKGLCPTCNRQFSIKSYERHVAWCKERAIRVPMSAATNIAKERLEARMRYRAPAFKNRRPTNREKYSPVSALNLSGKINNGNSTNQRAKETASTPNCNKGGDENTGGGNSQSQKATINTRRSTQSREGISSGPMKSRLSDRSSRPSIEPETPSNSGSPRKNSSRISNNVFQRLTCRSSARSSRTKSSPQRIFDEDEERETTISGSVKNRRRNIVQARSFGNPRLNDVTINDEVIGMIVQSCGRQKSPNENVEFVTWKKIGEDRLLNDKCSKSNLIVKDRGKVSLKSVLIEDEIENLSNQDEETFVDSKNYEWTSKNEKLDQTYLIRESLDDEQNFADLFRQRKKRPVIDSPRFEFSQEKRGDGIFLENLNLTKTENRGENSLRDLLGLSFGKSNESARNFDENPLFSGRPKLEPLNLKMIENEEIPDLRETSRSEKSVESLREMDWKKLTTNSRKLEPISATESVKKKPSNFESCTNKITDKSIDQDFIEDLQLKNHTNEISTSRSSRKMSSAKNIGEKRSAKKIESIIDEKSARDLKTENLNTSRSITENLSSMKNSSKLSTEKIEKSFLNDSSNFQYSSEENCENFSTKRSIKENDSILKSLIIGSDIEKNNGNSWEKHSIDGIDLNIDTDENEENSETPRSLKSKISSRINSNEILTKKMTEMRSIVANLNLNSYEKENCGNSKEKPCEIDLKVDKNEDINILYTSNFVDSKASIPLNLSESMDQETNRSIENKSSIDEPLNCEINESKNNEKSEEQKNISANVANESKKNYQRCGTYVIEKRTISNVSKKQETNDDFSDEKPLHKKRKTEIMASKNSKISSNFDNSIEEKSISAETGFKNENPTKNDQEQATKLKDTKLPKNSKISVETNSKKNSIFDNSIGKKIPSVEMNKSNDFTKNSEVKNLSKIDNHENQQIFEKYVNRKFNYESDDTFIDENYLKEYEAKSGTIVNEKISSGSELFNNNFRQKAFSDSFVMGKKMAVEENFSNESYIPEVLDSDDLRRENSSILPNEFMRPEVANSSERKSRENVSFENISPEVANSSERKSRENVSCENISPEVPSTIEMRRKLREKMKILRGSTNNLIKSMETSGTAIIDLDSSIGVIDNFEDRSKREIEKETIRKIDFVRPAKISDCKKSLGGFLPEIPIDRINDKNDKSRNDDRFLPLDAANSFYWQRAVKNTNERLISLDPPKIHRETRIPCSRLSFVGNLPPVVPSGKDKRRISDGDSRPVWNNYVRRHPDFNLVLKSRTGSCQDYDPFLIAERQMNDLLSDTCSEQSLTDSSTANRHRRRSSSPSLPNYPLAHSSPFVKYHEAPKNAKASEKRVSLIAPPTEFDDFSSDSTETNSINRETNDKNNLDNERRKNLSRDHVLGRRIIIDKSKALGTSETHDNSNFKNSRANRKLFDKNSAPKVGRSNSVRLVSAPKLNDRKINNSAIQASKKDHSISNNRNNNCASLSGSNVSLSSIVSSEIDVKRSNSLFDELSSFDDDNSEIFPSLRSFIKNDSLSVDSPVLDNRDTRNGRISDEEFSSPDCYNKQDHNKLSADSAYSSLNRKYSNYGRSTNDMIGRHEEDSPLRRREVDSAMTSVVGRSKMSKFCHECGSKFPDTAKFCCECGIKRLVL